MTVKIDSPIISAEVVKKDEPKVIERKKRPEVLPGKTYKLTNHSRGYNLYLTVNYLDNNPFEVFIDGSHTDATQWVKGISRLMSAMLRSTDTSFTLDFIGKELMKIHSDEGYHAGGKGGYVAGIVQHIGKTLLRIHKQGLEPSQKPLEEAVDTNPIPTPSQDSSKPRDPCPECGEPMTKLDGCLTCVEGCGYSKCS